MNRSRLFHLRAPALAAALAAATAVPIHAAEPDARAPTGAHPRMLEAFHERIRDTRVEGLPQGAYHLAKARAWVDAAIDVYHLGDRSAVLSRTLAEAERLLQQIDQREAPIQADTPDLAGTRRLREDLWQWAEHVKAHPGFACAQAPTARLEVMLAMSAHFAEHSGWREAKPYVLAAERLGREVQGRLAECAVPPPGQLPEAGSGEEGRARP